MSGSEGQVPLDPEGRFISKGAAHFNLSEPVITRDFYFLMLPKMTLLAFSAAVEPLRIANQLTGKCLYRWFLLTEDGASVRCSNGIQIVPDGPLSSPKKGDTVFICSGVDGYLAADEKTIAWLRSQARHGSVVGGICTGAFTLARAGLLSGRRFTLHWENQPAFRECFPDLPISNQLYCRDGSLITCGGGNACIDMMASLIEDNYGRDLATKVLEMCLNLGHRDGSRSQTLSVAAENGTRHPVLVDVLREISSRFADDLSIADLAERYALSRRRLERLFKSNLQISPAQKLKEVRLNHANSLIAETNMSMSEVAVACGFPSLDAFRKAYKKAFGSAPAQRQRSYRMKALAKAST
jgi:AraC family carnitine catabolism transcriptional activator